MLQSVALRVSQKAREAIVQAIKKQKVALDIWFVLCLLFSLENQDNFKLLEKRRLSLNGEFGLFSGFFLLEIWRQIHLTIALET